MLDATHDLLLLESLHGSMDKGVDIRPLVPDQALGTHCLELLFDLAEHQLYRIQLALIRNVEHPPYPKLFHFLLRFLRFVNL